jgi:hypothetical protein
LLPLFCDNPPPQAAISGSSRTNSRPGQKIDRFFIVPPPCACLPHTPIIAVVLRTVSVIKEGTEVNIKDS